MLKPLWKKREKIWQKGHQLFFKNRHLYLDERRPSRRLRFHSSCVSWEHTWLMACQRRFVITPHLQELLHFQTLNGLNRWADANEQVRIFSHMRMQGGRSPKKRPHVCDGREKTLPLVLYWVYHQVELKWKSRILAAKNISILHDHFQALALTP